VKVRYNETGTAYSGTAVTAGDVSYTFTDMPASTTLQSVSAAGLSVDIGGFVTLSGDLGFKKVGTDITAVAQDLEVPLARVIPVCLAEGRAYNVSDSLWAAILDHQPAANRVRLLRLREAQKKVEDWALLRRQLVSTGRLLKGLPGRLLG
jgi:hypothetical protein